MVDQTDSGALKVLYILFTLLLKLKALTGKKITLIQLAFEYYYYRQIHFLILFFLSQKTLFIIIIIFLIKPYLFNSTLFTVSDSHSNRQHCTYLITFKTSNLFFWLFITFNFRWYCASLLLFVQNLHAHTHILSVICSLVITDLPEIFFSAGSNAAMFFRWHCKLVSVCVCARARLLHSADYCASCALGAKKALWKENMAKMLPLLLLLPQKWPLAQQWQQCQRQQQHKLLVTVLPVTVSASTQNTHTHTHCLPFTHSKFDLKVVAAVSVSVCVCRVCVLCCC